MRKIMSLVGKIALVTFAVLLLCSPWIMSASALYDPDQIPVVSLYMDPFRIEGSADAIIKVNATIQGVTAEKPLFSFQIGALFNPATVECLSVTEGGFLSNNGADFVMGFPGSIDNTNGKVVPYGWTLTDPTKAKSGSGKLAIFTFRMKVSGYSDIHVYGFVPVDNTGMYSIETKVFDYYTAVMNGGEYIVKIVGNTQGSKAAGQAGYTGHSVAQINEPPYHGKLGFTVVGFPVNGNPFAYFNVTIPKNLMWCDTSDQWFVSLNGVQQAGRIVSQNATHTTISLEFAYSDSTPSQTVEIKSVYIVPEFSPVFFAMLLMLATFAAAILGKVTWSAKRKG